MKTIQINKSQPFGPVLKEARFKNCWTIQQMSDHLGIYTLKVNQIETGTLQPDEKLKKKIMKKLNIVYKTGSS